MSFLQKLFGKSASHSEPTANPEQDVKDTINNNVHNANALIDALETARHEISQIDHGMTEDQFRAVDMVLEGLEKELARPIDAVMDLKEYDADAADAIRVLPILLKDNRETDKLLNALTEALVEFRRSNQEMKTIYGRMELQEIYFSGRLVERKQELERHRKDYRIQTEESARVMQEAELELKTRKEAILKNGGTQAQADAETFSSEYGLDAVMSKLKQYENIIKNLEIQVGQLNTQVTELRTSLVLNRGDLDYNRSISIDTLKELYEKASQKRSEFDREYEENRKIITELSVKQEEELKEREDKAIVFTEKKHAELQNLINRAKMVNKARDEQTELLAQAMKEIRNSTDEAVNTRNELDLNT